MYLIKVQCSEHKRHLNYLKIRHTEEGMVMPMEVFCDKFEVPARKYIEPRRTRFGK